MHLRCKLKHGEGREGREANLPESKLQYKELKQLLMAMHSCIFEFLTLLFLSVLSFINGKQCLFSVSKSLNDTSILHFIL